jgi:nucleotide-binding universal stress UspA family protein
MSKRFKGPDAKAVVGIKFDSESRDLFIAACQLCAKTGMSLRVVHITQNILSRWIYRDEAYYEQLLGGREFADITSDLRDESIQRARQKMEDFLAENPSPVVGEYHIVASTDPAEALLADAVAQHASLLIVGINKERHGFFQRDLSTAINIMAITPIPVLILPEGLNFQKDSYKVLVADNLSPDGEQAFNCGASLATALTHSDVMHTHVIDYSFKDLVARLEFIKTDDALTSQSPQELWALAEQRAYEALLERANGLPHLIEAVGGHYKQLVLTGDVPEELDQALKHFKPDLVVFGRPHQQRRLFRLGSLALHVLHARTYGVLIAPPM